MLYNLKSANLGPNEEKAKKESEKANDVSTNVPNDATTAASEVTADSGDAGLVSDDEDDIDQRRRKQPTKPAEQGLNNSKIVVESNVLDPTAIKQQHQQKAQPHRIGGDDDAACGGQRAKLAGHHQRIPPQADRPVRTAAQQPVADHLGAGRGGLPRRTTTTTISAACFGAIIRKP